MSAPDDPLALVLQAQAHIRRRHFADAERLLLRALPLFADDDLDRTACLNNLGMLYHVLGDPGRAEPLLREVVEARRRLVGEAHPSYRQSLLDLAAFYRSRGDLVRAEEWQRRHDGDAGR